MHALRPEEEIHCLIDPAAAAAAVPGAAADADGLLAAFRVGQATPHGQRVSDKLPGAPLIAAGAGSSPANPETFEASWKLRIYHSRLPCGSPAPRDAGRRTNSSHRSAGLGLG